MCLAVPSRVTPISLVYLITYHVQSFVEIDLLLQVSDVPSFSEESQITILRNLYVMILHEVGRHAVLSALALTCSEEQAKGSSRTAVGPTDVLLRLLTPPESDIQVFITCYISLLMSVL